MHLMKRPSLMTGECIYKASHNQPKSMPNRDTLLALTVKYNKNLAVKILAYYPIGFRNRYRIINCLISKNKQNRITAFGLKAAS